MAKRKLTKLTIDEVSSVDRGANPGARVMLMKRDPPSASATIQPASTRRKPPKPKTVWEHQEMARAGSWQEEDRPKMSKLLRKMYRAYNRPSRKAPPPPIDVDEIARKIGKSMAKGKPVDPSMIAALRKSGALPGGGPEYFENVRPAAADYTDVREVDEPFAKMWKAALDLSGENGETPEVNFSRIYQDPRNREIVAAQKRGQFFRTTANALPLPGADADEIEKRDRRRFEHAQTLLKRGKAA